MAEPLIPDPYCVYLSPVQILFLALAAAVLLLLLPRLFGRKQERMLAEYEVLEKRFGLERRVARSKWGKGIGEHYSLAGSFRGYPLSLYGHYHKDPQGRVDWTSLVFETLFAGDFELRIEFAGTQQKARFPELKQGVPLGQEPGLTVCVTDGQSASYFASDALKDKLARFAQKPDCGAISLSKGFLEYREVGALEAEDTRLRYQEGFLLLADLADAVSVFVSQRSSRR